MEKERNNALEKVENTIENVGRLGRLGMRETDREIIRIMTGQKAEG